MVIAIVSPSLATNTQPSAYYIPYKLMDCINSLVWGSNNLYMIDSLYLYNYARVTDKSHMIRVDCC